MIRKTIGLTIFFAVLCGKADAYIDPGSGSVFLQVILGFFAAVGASIVFFWHKVVAFFSRLFSRQKK